MIRPRILALSLAVSVAACATVPVPSPERLDRIEQRYEQIKTFASLLLPYLSPERAARIRLAGQIADRALLAARAATTARARAAAIAEAEAAVGAVDVAIDGPR